MCAGTCIEDIGDHGSVKPNFTCIHFVNCLQYELKCGFFEHDTHRAEQYYSFVRGRITRAGQNEHASVWSGIEQAGDQVKAILLAEIEVKQHNIWLFCGH